MKVLAKRPTKRFLTAAALLVVVIACEDERGGEQVQANAAPEAEPDETVERDWYIALWEQDEEPVWKLRTGELPEQPGFYEVTQYPDAEATPEQRRSAEEFAKRTLQTARKNGWFDYATGRRDGFHLMIGNKTHFQNDAFLADDRVLDPEHPEFLMYYKTPQGMQLAGAMFMARNLTEKGRQIGGPLTTWHFHVWPYDVCLVNTVMIPFDRANKECAGTLSRRSAEMLHVWFVDHPRGLFDTSMTLSEEVLNKPLP